MFSPDSILERAVAWIPVLLSLTVHEWAHAWTAWRLGDDTAKLQGRVSLNPIVHIDPIGTLLLPLMGVPFGWAKPVPINPVRFRPGVSMSQGMLLAVAAGPLSNVLLAAVMCVLLAAGTSAALAPQIAGWIGPDGYMAMMQLVMQLVIINVLLACFNLLPIPPLDGSRIADALMPASLQPGWTAFKSLGPLLLLAVILLPSLVGIEILAWPIYFVQELLTWIVRR